MEGLFGVGSVGGQADHAGDALQREVGFRCQGQQTFKEPEYRDFARSSLQEAGPTSQGLDLEGLGAWSG